MESSVKMLTLERGPRPWPQSINAATWQLQAPSPGNRTQRLGAGQRLPAPAYTPEPRRLQVQHPSLCDWRAAWALPSGGLGSDPARPPLIATCRFLGCLFRGWRPPAWCLQESLRQPRGTEPGFHHVSVHETAAPRGQVTVLRSRRWGVVTASRTTSSAQWWPHPRSPRAAPLAPVRPLRLQWLSQTTPLAAASFPQGQCPFSHLVSCLTSDRAP